MGLTRFGSQDTAILTFNHKIFSGGKTKMAKQKFERTKPHVYVGTIGHVDHG